MPEVNLGGEVDVEEEEHGDEVERDVADEGGGGERERGGVDGDEADDEGRDERAGGEDRGEAGAVVAGAERRQGREDVRRAVAEREQRHGRHGRREAEQRREARGDHGEVVLRGLDERVEVEPYEPRQDGDRQRRS